MRPIDSTPPMERQPPGLTWHDLTHLSRWDRLREFLHPLPWLVLSLACYSTDWWVLGAPASFMFYLCAIRLNHEAIHGNLGLTRNQDHIVLHTLSMVMGGSNSAVAYAHLLHHKDTMGPRDFEGRCGHMPLTEVLRYGPRFNLDIWREAWVHGSARLRRRVLVDFALNLALLSIAFGYGIQCLMLHVAAITTALCLSAFFAVWITHQGTGQHGIIARSQRGPLARMAYLLFYHREHHLYPKVPVSRLPQLADRLDRNVLGYVGSRLPVVPWLDWGPDSPSIPGEAPY